MKTNITKKIKVNSNSINLNKEIMKKSFLEAEEIQNLGVNVQTKFSFADDKENEKEEEEDQGDRKGGRVEV